MKVVRHDAVVAALDIVPVSGVAKDDEKHAVVVIIQKDLHPTVASRDHVTQKALVLTTLLSRHAFVYTRSDPSRISRKRRVLHGRVLRGTRFSRDSCPQLVALPAGGGSAVRQGSERGQSRVRVGSESGQSRVRAGSESGQSGVRPHSASAAA